MEKKKIISIAAALFGVLAYFLISHALSPVLENRKINNYLKKEAETLNSQCPYTIEEGLVMEKVSFVKDKRVIYEYRLLNYSKSDFIDLEGFRTNVTQSIIDSLRADNSLNDIKNKDVHMEYVYLDYQYEEIFRIDVLLNTPIIAIEPINIESLFK